MADLLFPDESYAVQGALFEVYKEKGYGFVEPVYHACMKIELEMRGIPAISKPKLELDYKGRMLEETYEPDFICYGKIIVELKSVSQLVAKHRAKVHNYLRATKLRLGILANFGGHPRLEYERIVL